MWTGWEDIMRGEREGVEVLSFAEKQRFERKRTKITFPIDIYNTCDTLLSSVR
jgi:hypothetical protein